jgi:hypothetical protein
MKFAHRVFTTAGVWGLATLTPLYFTFGLVGRSYPPAITHADFYYGFVGVALAWQVAFLIIGANPIRYRPLMLAAVLEKLTYISTMAVLYGEGRLQISQFAAAGPDYVFLALFIISFAKTPGSD